MKKIERLIPLIVLAAGLAAYHNSLQNGFVFDDKPYIVKNPHIRSLWPPQAVLAHSTRPMVNFSFAANYALHGLKPWGYHLLNLVIHLLAGLLVYGVVRRSMQSERLHWKWSNAAPWLAGLVAILWVVHPLQTESVSYVWQRCESLMGLLYLLTLYCVIRSNSSVRANWWALGAIVSCALGMASKEAMVTAPLLVLLYDWVFLAGSWRELARRRWGLYLGLATTWLILLALLVRGTTQADVFLPTAHITYQGIRPWQYLLTQSGVIVHYLRLALWPDRLCLDYGTGWSVANSIADVWPQLFVVGGLLLATAWAWWRRPALGFIGTWFFLILAPTSSFAPIVDVVFEHRMYLSLATVIVLVVLAVVTLLDRLPNQRNWLQWGTSAAALAVVIACIIVTIRRNEDYRSSATIWEDTVKKMPQNPRARNNWGLALQSMGRVDEAILQYEKALRLNPYLEEVENDWGKALQDQGNLEEAVKHYQAALQIYPGIADAHNNWGSILKKQGHIDEAVAHYEQALQLKPDYAEAHYNLANALESQQNMKEAMAHYQEALQLDPEFAEAHNNWGRILAMRGQLEEAVSHFQESLRLKPEYEPARANLRQAESLLQNKKQRFSP